MSLTHVSLGEVAAFVRGVTFKPEDVGPVSAPGAVACMRTSNVQSELDLSDVWGIRSSLVKRDDQYLREGDVLVSSANSWNLVGKCCRVPELPWAASFGGFVSVLRADQQRVDPRFLYRWFASTRIQTTVRSFGQRTTSISNLNLERCLKLPFPLPPLPEQRRIAEVLDRAEGLRANRRSALAQLDNISQSIFVDLFGDPFSGRGGVVLLGEIADIDMGQSPPGSSYNTTGIGIPLLNGPTEFGRRYPIQVQWTTSPTRLCKAGDILFCVRGATAGRLNRADKTYCLGRGLAAIRPRVGAAANADFLYSVLDRYYSYFQETGVGSTFINISRDDLKNLPFPRPHEDHAAAFASRVAALERLRTTHEASLTEMDSLFASMQDRAFVGEL